MQLLGFSFSFACGEIAEDAWERVDLAQHQTGCEEAINFLGLTTGPNASRGGFFDRGDPIYQDRKQRVVPWLRADGEGLVLELGDHYARVWTARGAPVDNGLGDHMEFPTGWGQDDLAGLCFRQVGDVAYVTHRSGTKKPQVMIRFSDTSWSLADQFLIQGPFLPENTDTAKTMIFTDPGSGPWDIETNFDFFAAGHVGALLRVRPNGGYPGFRTWAPNTTVAAGDNWISAGRVYAAGAAGTTGNTPPNHDNGTVSDGAIDWLFLHDGAQNIAITAVTDSQHAEGNWIGFVAAPSATPTSSWAEGAFSDYRGWPVAPAGVREERLFYAKDDALYGSRSFGFDQIGADFKPGLGTGEVADDDAVRTGLGTSRARVVWVVDALNLLVGTTDGEHVVSGATVEDPITPADIKPRKLSGWGSADVDPVVVQGPPTLLLHITRGGTTLREMQLSSGLIEPQGRDLSLLAQHVFGLGVVEMAWSRPDNNLWLRLSDGSLAAFTYHFEHGILGVRRQEIGGGWTAESICTSPDAEGRDRLTVAAYRMKDGAQQRAHFVLALRSEAVWVDGAQQYDGAPIDTVTGLSRYEGEDLAVLADGSYLGLKTVSGGEIDLEDDYSVVTVGLPMRRRFKSLPLDPDHTGEARGRRERPTQGWVVFGGVTLNVRAEPQDSPGEALDEWDPIDTRRATDTVPVVRRGRRKVTFAAGADADNRICMECSDPFDLVLYALRPVVESN